MEATALVGRLVGRPGEAISPKSCRGRTLREIVALKACSCRGTIGLLRSAIRCSRSAAIEAGAIPRAAVLLIDRRLHVVVRLLYRPVPRISLRRAGKSLSVSRVVPAAVSTRAIASGPALGKVALSAV